MIIPSKFQWSGENDSDNSIRINNITKKYNTCIKKFGNSLNNKSYSFQTQVIEWFFSLSFIERLKISSINNKWVFHILHQLYIEQKLKKNLKFIPRITEKTIPFMKNLKGRDIFADNPGHFLNYFAICSEKYELIPGYNENMEKQFLNEIIFFYPDLSKIAKIKTNGNDGNLIYLMKYYYPIIALSETILKDQEKFKEYFKILSNDNYFKMPPEITNFNIQKEINNSDFEEENKIFSSFNKKNLNSNSINSLNDSKINNSSNNNYNNKIQNIIDLPKWAKQPTKSKLCFSISELFLAFFEQNISVYYILNLYDNQYYKSLINETFNKNLEEFLSLKNELKDFLCLNKENLLSILNIDIITKDIYYNANIEKFVCIKKYQNNLISNTKFWQENKSFEEEYNLIKEYFNGYNNDTKSMLRLINDITMFTIDQIYSYEDFFLNKILFNLYKKYESNKEEDLIYDITNTQKESKKKKKKNRKKKKKKESEEQENNNINNNENKIEKDNVNNDKIIEIKKFISIEEDEELSKIKKGYSKIDNNENNNMLESSESENNCDTNPLLANDECKDYRQIMKDKEYKYCSTNEYSDSINELNNIINNKINDDNKIEKREDMEILERNEEDNESKSEENDNKNEIIESDNNINQDNKINNNKKKKGNNFFLYPTVKKATNDKINKPPFIMKLNEDILSYNKDLLTILDLLSPIKEHIIETIKSHIKSCFINENFLYQIEVYGSFKSHLDIVCSDIDMVFIPQSKNLDVCDLILKLSNHLQSLKKYNKVTPIYTASIPLIKLMINYENYLEDNKSLLNNYSKLENSTIYKNYPFNKEKELSFVNIDISFPTNYNNKKNKNAPFHQIEFIKNSLSKYIEANIVIRILKRALKITDMNNSYKGGLSSYTIFLLVISYMKYISKNNNSNNKHKSNGYGHAFHDVVKYFSKFDFYLNIIDIDNKNGEIYNKRSKKYSSLEYENIPIIIDPVTGLNAGKSSFRINDVQNVFISLNEEMEKLRKIYDKDNSSKINKENEKDKEKSNFDNLIITLLKNVENKYLI